MARAQTPAAIDWANLSTDFTNTANWTNGSIVNNTTSTIAQFGTAATVQPTIASAFSVAGVRFLTTAGAYTLSGAGPLTIGASGIDNQNTATTETISVPLVFGTAATITNQGSLVLSGSIANNTTTGLTLSGLGSGGSISGVISGTAPLFKNGSGTWTLSGANTYSGKTEIDFGTLAISADNNLGAVPGSVSANALTLNGGALKTTASFTLAANRGISLLGTGGTLLTDVGSTLTYAGLISGSGTFNKAGAGTLVLSGANTYSAQTNIQDGTLSDGVAGAFSSNSGIRLMSGTAVLNVNFNETIAGLGGLTASAGSSVNLATGVALTIKNAALTYAGTIAGNGAIVISGPGSQTFAGASTYAGGTTINAGTLILTNTSGSGTGAGAVTIANGALLQLGSGGPGGAVAGNIVNNGNLLFASTDSTTYGGVISGSGSLNVGAFGGVGTLTLTGANLYTGRTNIGTGTLRIGATNALPTGTSVSFSSGGTLDVASDQTISQLFGGAGNASVQLAAGKTLTIAPTAGGFGGGFNGTIGGAGSLTFAGASNTELSLDGASTYSGGTTVSSGTLLVGTSTTMSGSTIVSGPVGTGPLTITSNGHLGMSGFASGEIKIANPISVANNATLGGGKRGDDDGLQLTGVVTVPTSSAAVHLDDFVVFSGTVKAASGTTALTFDSVSGDFGKAVMVGTADPSIASINANGAAVIFGSTTAVPASGLAVQASTGYIGIASVTGYTTPTAASVLSLIPNRATFTGALGFDTADDNTPPHVFADNLDLTGFGAGFSLGSLSKAVLTGTITPAASGYSFGNGRGALIVQSALTGNYGVTVASSTSIANNGLITILRGANSFTGNLSVSNSMAVLDSATALPAGKTVSLGAGGYIGYTEAFTGEANLADFLAHRVASYTSTAVIGLDSQSFVTTALSTTRPSAQRYVSELIDLSALGPVYLGTATGARFAGTILAPNQGGANKTLSLLASDEGMLSIASSLLAANVSSVVVGSTTVGYANGVVSLDATNTYAGGTTLLSGTLGIDGSSKIKNGAIVAGPLGTGVLTVAANANSPGLVATYGSATVNNPIALGTALRLGFRSNTSAVPSFSLLSLNGTISDVDGTHPGSLQINSASSVPNLPSVVLAGANTFTGGVTLQSGTLGLANDLALGSGPLTVASTGQSGISALLALGTGTRTIANNIVLGAPLPLYLGGSFNLTGSLTLNGNAELRNTPTSLSVVNISGAVSGGGRLLINGSNVVLSGNNTYTGGTESDSGSLIFASAASMPTTPNPGLTAAAAGYIGISFVPANLQSGFLDRFNKSATGATIGLDSPSSAGTPNTFSGSINLTGFQSTAQIGSTTSAILTGVITPQGSSYNFGGGAGFLGINSALVDPTAGGTRSVVVGSSGLTVRLGATNTYSGGTTVLGSALIFGPGALPASGSILVTSGGYVGTEDTAYAANPNGFINRMNAGSHEAIVGFDSATGTPYAVTGNISLAGFGSTVAPLYLGTATRATISGAITLMASDPTYRFAGFKGGQLTVTSTLSGANSVQIGDPLSFFGRAGSPSVTLTGDNTYTGGTQLSVGGLLVGRNSALGGAVGGALSVGNSSAPGLDLSLAASAAVDPVTGAAINLSNAIALNSSLTLSGSNDFVLSGAITSAAPGVTIVPGRNGYVLKKVGSSTVTLSGHNTLGGVAIDQGGMTFVQSDSIGGGALSFGSTGLGAVANFLASTVISGLHGGDGTSQILLGGGTSFTVNSYFDSDFGGSISSPGASVVYSSPSSAPVRVFLSGANNYNGGTTINSGVTVIAANGSAFGPSSASANTITVNGGKLALDAGVALSNPITITSGKLGGVGTFKPLPAAGGFAIGTGIALAPGIGGPGKLTFDGGLLATSTLLLNGGGEYHWQLIDATNSNGGWDTIAVNGAVNIAATTAAPFTFKLITLDFTGNAGIAANFNRNDPYAWTVLSATSITGFTGGNQFVVDSSGFLNPNSGLFTIGLNPAGTSLMLNFSPVPEPSTYALLIAGLGLTFFASRRRKR